MKFAQWTYRIAAVWGFLVLTPMYFMESKIGMDQPPAITHPEYFYGFVGVGLVWQIAFWMISTDPLKYRPLMILSILEKLSFCGALAVLFLLHRVGPQMGVALVADSGLGALFAVAYVKTNPKT